MSSCQINSPLMSSTHTSNVNFIFDFQKPPLGLLNNHFQVLNLLSMFFRTCQFSAQWFIAALHSIMSEAFSLSLCWDKVHRLSFIQHALIFGEVPRFKYSIPSRTKLLSVQWKELIHSLPSQMFYSFLKSFCKWFSNQIPFGKGESEFWLYPVASIRLYPFFLDCFSVSEMFLANHFNENNKAVRANFIFCLQTSFGGVICELPWVSLG